MRSELKRLVPVIAAHPDDEALGRGGTIIRWTNDGANVRLAFLADGVGARGEKMIAALYPGGKPA